LVARQMLLEDYCLPVGPRDQSQSFMNLRWISSKSTPESRNRTADRS
jgi:hypothetical protein